MGTAFVFRLNKCSAKNIVTITCGIGLFGLYKKVNYLVAENKYVLKVGQESIYLGSNQIKFKAWQKLKVLVLEFGKQWTCIHSPGKC